MSGFQFDNDLRHAASEIYSDNPQMTDRERLVETLRDIEELGLSYFTHDVICMNIFGHKQPEEISDQLIPIFLEATDMMISFAKFCKTYGQRQGFDA